MPSSIHKEKNHGKTLFQFAEKTEIMTNKSREKRLEEFPVIKPGVGEKILCVQRKHPIALANAIIQQLFILLSILILILFTASFLQTTLTIRTTTWVVSAYMVLFAVCLFSVSLIYIFMNWYYEFYIITNRSILHRNCFRLAGPYSDIVYIDKMHLREITRVPPNILYDFLKIEDVHLYFQKMQQEEPFIFKTPSDAQTIEDLVHDLAIIDNKDRRRYD